MAKVYEDECVGCDTHCMGSVCPNRNVLHLICDKCKEDVEELYDTENGELCEECTLKQFKKVVIE